MTDTELATLRAAMDRVYPRDDAPGATDLGTDQFLIRLLENTQKFIRFPADLLQLLIYKNYSKKAKF